MKSYIEEWFKKAVNKLINEGKEAVETVPVTVDENDKRTYFFSLSSPSSNYSTSFTRKV
jgi:hypothetical protein